MANFKSLRIKSAVKSRSKEQIGYDHLTTGEIGQLSLLWFYDCMPGAKIDCKSGRVFSRMAPLVKPTYGKVYYKTMEVFVPYFQVCDNFDGFVQGQPSDQGLVAASRFITKKVLFEMFLFDVTLATAVTAADVATGSWYDIIYTAVNGTLTYLKFTDKGRYYVKLLNQLGYCIPMNVDLQTTSYWYTTESKQKRNALPLLCFAKAYNDWMSQSQRFNSSILSKLLKCVRHDVTCTDAYGNTAYSSIDHSLTRYGIACIFENMLLCYENDYFTSAWQDMNRPILSEYYSPSSNGTVLSYQNFGGEEISADNVGNYLADLDGNGVIYQRSLDFLKSYDDWTRRNNYVGSRDVEKVYARFGLKPEDYRANYAHEIGRQMSQVQVGDVTAVAQDYVGAGAAENIELGDYAGKGILNHELSFNYLASDFGLCMVIGWYTVAPMNSFGEDKCVMRTTPVDFYTPEFDGMAGEPIAVSELYCNPRIQVTTKQDSVFGFTELYNSYRMGRDKITGDFRRFPLVSGTYAKTGTEMNTWHTGRYLDSILSSANLVAQNPNFNCLPQLNSEFNRIFSVVDSSADHFYLICQFDIDGYLPMLSSNQVPRLGEGDTVVPRNGNEIN